jgi:hypothetical protein
MESQQLMQNTILRWRIPIGPFVCLVVVHGNVKARRLAALGLVSKHESYWAKQSRPYGSLISFVHHPPFYSWTNGGRPSCLSGGGGHQQQPHDNNATMELP